MGTAPPTAIHPCGPRNGPKRKVLGAFALRPARAVAADQREPLGKHLLQVGDGPALAQHVPVAARWLDLLGSGQVRGRGERNSTAHPAFPGCGNFGLGGERNAKVMPLRAVKGYFLAWCQVRVTVVLIARCSEPGAAQCTFGHKTLPPRRSAFPDINAGYANKIPALSRSNRETRHALPPWATRLGGGATDRGR